MKKCLSILLALILVIGSMTIAVNAASEELSDVGADTDLAVTGVDDYPYRDTAPNLYYEEDEWLFYKGECTSFCAWRLNHNNGVAFHNYYKGVHWGNGRNWGVAAKEIGIRVDNIPAIGAIAWWNTADEHHVAWVAKVNSDGTVFIEEYNKRIPGKDYGDHKYHTRTISASSPSGYIHIKDIGSSVSPIDIGPKFYANIVPTATNSNGLASTGANFDLVETGTAKTQDEAIAWAKSKVGKSIDTDGYPSEQPYQCVDFIKAYYEFLGTTSPGGNGKDYATNKLPSGWQRIKGAQPVKGDILVYDGNTNNPYGHVGIYESDYVSYHQNFNGQHKVCICTYKYNALSQPYWGVVRPNFSNIQYQNLGDKFYANIVPTGASSSLAVTANGTNVELGTLDYSDAQKWLFERKDGNAYKITNVQKNKCLDVDGYGTANGTNIQLWTSNDSTAQRWYIVKNGAGYRLVPQCTPGSCLDIKGGTMKAGTNIQEYTQNESTAQRFNIKKLVYNLNYTPNGASGSVVNTTVSEKDKITVKANPFSKSGYTFAGYFLYRNSDEKWYTVSNGWVTASVYRENGYKLKLFSPNQTITIDSSLTNGVAPNSSFALQAQWLPNESKVNFAENYSGCNYLLGSDLAYDYSNYISSRDTDTYTLSVDSTEQYNNYNSLKIVGASAGSSGHDLRLQTTTNDGYGEGYSLAGIAGDNKNLVMGFYAKSSVNGAKFYVRWGYSGTYRSVTLTKDWKYYTVSIPKVGYFGSCLHPYFDSAGTFYLNSISVTDGDTAPEFVPETGRWACSQMMVKCGGKISKLPIPQIREGYTFEGWYTAANGGTAVTENTSIEAQKITLYAHWVKDDIVEPVRVKSDGFVGVVNREGNVILNEYTGSASDIVLPSEIEGRTVTEIFGFWDNETIESIVIPETVKILDGDTFEFCTNLKSVDIGGVETIGQFSFFNCSELETVTLHEGLKEIQYSSFMNCPKLTAITIPRSVELIHDLSFGHYYDEDGVLQTAEAFTVYGYKNSAGEAYALNNGFTFVDLGATSQTEDKILGDADGDEEVTSIDVTLVQRYCALMDVGIDLSVLMSADVDDSGELEITDATYIQRYLALIDIPYSVGEKKV